MSNILPKIYLFEYTWKGASTIFRRTGYYFDGKPVLHGVKDNDFHGLEILNAIDVDELVSVHKGSTNE